jgi:hypothetical protein
MYNPKIAFSMSECLLLKHQPRCWLHTANSDQTHGCSASPFAGKPVQRTQTEINTLRATRWLVYYEDGTALLHGLPIYRTGNDTKLLRNEDRDRRTFVVFQVH